METIKVRTSQHVDIDYPVAGLGERISARLIDLGIFLGVYILFIILAALFTGVATDTAVPFVIAAVIYGAGFVFYNLLTEMFMDGQSIGKRLLKIKVISLDGAQASMGQYLIRWLFRLVDFYLTGQVGGLICVALSENKQRIGDLVAGTVVIKTTQRTTYDHIAFRPIEEAGYVPVFNNVDQLSDRDMELIHEVIRTYYKTFNTELIYATAARIKAVLGISIPEGMNELHFLETLAKDYNHITAAVDN